MTRVDRNIVRQLYSLAKKTGNLEPQFNELLDKFTTEKYYELYELNRRGNNGFYTYLTGTEIATPEWTEQINNLKDGEYYSRFGHLKEITMAEYDKRANKMNAPSMARR